MSLKIVVAALAVGLGAGAAFAEMEIATPESQGVSSRAILDWIDACEKKFDGVKEGRVHGFVIVRHGKTIADKAAMLRKYACQNKDDGLVKEKLDQAKARGAERTPKCAAVEVFTTYDGLRIEKGVLELLDETALVK